MTDVRRILDSSGSGGALRFLIWSRSEHRNESTEMTNFPYFYSFLSQPHYSHSQVTSVISGSLTMILALWLKLISHSRFGARTQSVLIVLNLAYRFPVFPQKIFVNSNMSLSVILILFLYYVFNVFLNLVPLLWGGIFSTTFYGLYFSHHTC